VKIYLERLNFANWSIDALCQAQSFSHLLLNKMAYPHKICKSFNSILKKKMYINSFERNKFQKNIEKSMRIIKDRKYEDYYLKRNGEITLVTSWLGRFIRWILDKFFEKTIRDIWQVVKKVKKDFNKSLERSLKFKENEQYLLIEEINPKFRRLMFSIKFLYSRKKMFDKWVKKEPKIAESLKKEMDKYRATKLKYSEWNKLISAFEKVYFPRLSRKAIRKKPPLLTMSVSPLTDKSRYCSLKLQRISDYYQQIPLNQYAQSLARHLVDRFNSGCFFDDFIEGCENEHIPKRDLPTEFKPNAPLKLEEPLTMRSLSDLWESMRKSIFIKIPIKGHLRSKKRRLILVKEVIKQGLSTLTLESRGKLDFLLLQEFHDRGANLRGMINSVNERDKTVFGVNSKMHHQYYEQIECFLKNILYELESSEISKEKRVEIVSELAMASSECSARWVEESKRQYRKLKLKNLSELEGNILEHLQVLKEDLILELFQNQTVNNELFEQRESVEFHILNTFRREFGEEFGLDCSSCRLDMFAKDIEQGKETLKKVFIKNYSPSRIIRGVKERINLQLQEQYEPMYFSYLSERLAKKHPEIKDPSSYVMSSFMGPNYRSISEEGVIFLLTEMKFLKR